eukprot:15366966-Ditylum_brightwellii.AAC.1
MMELLHSDWLFIHSVAFLADCNHFIKDANAKHTVNDDKKENDNNTDISTRAEFDSLGINLLSKLDNANIVR